MPVVRCSQWLTSEDLKKFHITELPADPAHIMVKNSFQLTTFKVLATVMHQDLEDLYEDSGGDSFSFYSGHYSTYGLVIRDDMSYEDLMFSMAHEIGHIVLGHVGPDKTLLMKGNDFEEYQADRFAAYILGIDQVLVYEY